MRLIPLLSTTVLALAPPVMAAGLSPSSQENFARLDDVVLPVEVTAGNCPDEIRLWREYALNFEVGDHSGIMLDIASISQGKTEFIDSQEHSVTFRTPLTPEFYSCVASLGDGDNLDHGAQHYRQLYDLWFGQGHVYFHFDISPIAPEPHEDWYFAKITHQEIVGQYPYVRWAVGD